MRAGIVITDPSDWTARAMLTSFTGKGIDAFFLNFSDLIASIIPESGTRFRSSSVELQELDAIIVRDLGKSGANDVAFRFETLLALQELHIPIINPPQAIARAANKFATSLALQKAKVATPKTAVTTSLAEARAVLQDFGRAVSKPLFGYKGKGIVLLEEGVDADIAMLEKILKSEGLVYLQEFIPLESPRDIRAFVVGGQLPGAIYRNAPSGQWISNLARGGRPSACPVSSELQDLAVRAARAVGAVYCGVDLLETASGYCVIEVNGTPSGKGIYEALNIDVTEDIARIVHQNCYLRGR